MDTHRYWKTELTKYPITFLCVIALALPIAVGPFLTFALTEEKLFYEILPFIIGAIIFLAGITVYVQRKEKRERVTEQSRSKARSVLLWIFRIVAVLSCLTLILPEVSFPNRMRAIWILVLCIPAITVLTLLNKTLGASKARDQIAGTRCVND